MVAYVIMALVVVLTPAFIIARYLWVVRKERRQAMTRPFDAGGPTAAPVRPAAAGPVEPPAPGRGDQAPPDAVDPPPTPGYR